MDGLHLSFSVQFSTSGKIKFIIHVDFYPQIESILNLEKVGMRLPERLNHTVLHNSNC